MDQLTDSPETVTEPPFMTLSQKNLAAVALGGLDGKKGGPALAKKLSKTPRKRIASNAAKARWKKERTNPRT